MVNFLSFSIRFIVYNSFNFVVAFFSPPPPIHLDEENVIKKINPYSVITERE